MTTLQKPNAKVTEFAREVAEILDRQDPETKNRLEATESTWLLFRRIEGQEVPVGRISDGPGGQVCIATEDGGRCTTSQPAVAACLFAFYQRP